jgi:hypothetical protein
MFPFTAPQLGIKYAPVGHPAAKATIEAALVPWQIVFANPSAAFSKRWLGTSLSMNDAFVKARCRGANGGRVRLALRSRHEPRARPELNCQLSFKKDACHAAAAPDSCAFGLGAARRPEAKPGSI